VQSELPVSFACQASEHGLPASERVQVNACEVTAFTQMYQRGSNAIAASRRR